MDDEIMAEFRAIAEWHAESERDRERAKRRQRILNRELNDRMRYMEHVRRVRQLFSEADQLARKAR